MANVVEEDAVLLRTGRIGLVFAWRECWRDPDCARFGKALRRDEREADISSPSERSELELEGSTLAVEGWKKERRAPSSLIIARASSKQTAAASKTGNRKQLAHVRLNIPP